MPAWQPNWIDVDFDHAAADAAATAYDDAADRLAAGDAPLATVVTHTVVDWSGTARTHFDTGVDRIEDERTRVAAALRRAADMVRAGVGRAEAEQQHREDERDRWRRERDAEILAEAERREEERRIAEGGPR